MKKITVVMAALNEEKALPNVVSQIRKVVPNANILIVDDGSVDKTNQLAAELGCDIIKNFFTQGYGFSLCRGLWGATGDIIVTLDCDGTYPAEQIPELVQWIKKGYDLVDGSRLFKRPPSMPIANYLANKIFVFVANILFRKYLKNYKIKDLHSGMRAYNRRLFEEVNFDYNGSALPVEILIKTIMKGYKVKIVPISYNERVGHTKLDRIRSTYMTFKRMFRLWRSK